MKIRSNSAGVVIAALKAKKVGSQWMALCPAHDDRNPSLSIAERHGRLLLHCHAGCPQRAVIDALKQLGVWEPHSDGKLSLEQRIVCAYDYTDASGALLYQVVRLHSPKSFRQRYPDGRGGYTWKKHPQQTLYRLREVLDAPIVFLVEGEKDVETLRSCGFVATTKAGGAESPWLDEYTEILAGREVILIPDNDRPGRELVLKVARTLLDKAARIIVLELEGAKDVTEWFESGQHSELELIAQVEGEAVSR